MKFLKEGLLFLFIAIQINTFCLAENLNGEDETKNEVPELMEFTAFFWKQLYKSSVSNILKYYDRFDIINEFMEPNIKHLCVVFATDMKDSIKLAEILSNNNRLLPEKKQNYSEADNLLYNEIVQIYYLYYNKELSAHIFVFPSNVRNTVLETYFVRKTIDSSEELKFVMTCSEECNKRNISSVAYLTAMASNIATTNYAQIVNNIENQISFLPLSFKDLSKFEDALKAFQNLKKEMDNGVTIRSIVEVVVKMYEQPHLMINLNKDPQGILKHHYDESNLTARNYVSRESNTLKYSHLFANEKENLDFLKKPYSHIEPLSVDITPLRGLLNFPDWLGKISNTPQPYKDSMDSEEERFIKNACNNKGNKKQLEIIRQVCLVYYLLDIVPYSIFIYFQNITIDYYLREEKDFFSKFSLMYKNKVNGNKIEIPNQPQDMYEKIIKLNEPKKDIMLEAFFVFINSLSPEAEHLCTKIDEETYKLQVKGKFLILSQIMRKNYCSGKVRILELLALDKIVINEDLVTNEIKSIIIMAPIWDIVWNRVIHLDRINDFAGSFYGIANTIINDRNLSIKTTSGTTNRQPKDVHAYDIFYETPYLSGQNIHGPGIEGKVEKGATSEQIQFFSLNDTGFNINVTELYYYFLIKQPIVINEFTPALVNYRKYVLENTIKTSKTNYADLYGKLNTNVHLIKNLSTPVFIDELYYLEENNSPGSNESILHSLYLGLQDGLYLYENDPQRLEGTDDYKLFLSKLGIMISTKTDQLYGNYHNYAVVNINEYIEHCKEYGKQLRNLEIIKTFRVVSTKFKKEFDEQIEEASKLIKSNLQVIVEKKFDDLNKEIEKLVKEVKDLIKKGEQTLEKLKEKKKELELQLFLKSIFTIFKFILYGLSFINPVCGAVGAVISAGLDIGEAIWLNADAESDFKEFKIPDSVSTDVKSSLTKYSEEAKKEYEEVEKQLKEINAEKEKLSEEEAKPLNDVVKLVNQTCTSDLSFSKKCMTEILETKETELTTKSLKEKKNYDRSLKVIKGAEVALDVVKLGVDSYNKIKKDVSAIEKIDQEIDKVGKNIKKLQEFEKKIHKTLKPQIESIRKGIRETTKGYNISSRALLEYKKFEMGEYLNKISSELDGWTKQFNVSKEIQDTMGQLKAAMNTIIQMHTLIKEFDLHKRQADYLTEVASVPYTNTNVKDLKFKEILARSDVAHIAKIIINDYDKLSIAMKGYAYPFLREYSDFFTRPNIMFNSNFLKASNIVDKITQLNLKLQVRKGHGEIFKQCKYDKFGLPGGYSAFYTWKNNTHSSYIKDILEGKKVVLYANISQQPNFNAIKFQNIDFLFSSPDKETNAQLQKDFNDFHVLFTHHGDSHYRCTDKIHVIKSGTYGTFFQSITSTRSKRQVSNSRNDKHNIDYVLSPFATWTVQLKALQNGQNLTSLAKYVNKVNLELVGEGQYLVADENVCKEYIE
ncbi:uncharacterized protein LOC127285045 [Leptopilina boulardi]|uniref:uncharacterized protein LOC127285045 n=1 Tax=Leptopilina boulardi TaxID=63433 RepID=UPI0021F525A1|nr:uncharacterized protein LOC127285045 [Leptopilina boulardi]